MGATNIQAKIRSGLAKAINKTGSTSSELVYLVSEQRTGGTPATPPVIVTTDVLLVDAIFQSFDTENIDGDILSGDRKLVSNSDVVIEQGNTIKQGTKEYIVVSVDIKAPTSDVLAYISQVRLK